MAKNQKPFVSVVIPVYNDNERLKMCMDRLDKQTYGRENFEIIVVDNNSTQNVSEITSQYKDIILLHEKKPGPYAATNTGLKKAKGPVIAFTASDVKPELDWIEKGVEGITSKDNIGILAGEINIFFANHEKPTTTELYEKVFEFNQKRAVKKVHFGITANVLTWKKLFDELGLYNDEHMSGGDREWGLRVYNAGYEILYYPDCKVHHPARQIDEFKRKLKRIINKGYFEPEENKSKFAKFFLKAGRYISVPFREFAGLVVSKKVKGFRKKLRVFWFIIYRVFYILGLMLKKPFSKKS